ncbi:hypothetical protein HV318_01695 [Enterobacter sp. RHBSTW-00901]|jgi:hypothetical protein|uniref:Uncharacterized protein n=1 Tax=Enterobacter mori TaxID=539813 RepID=A0A7T0H207_9ENTR|nr:MULTISPECIES: hypothetical protein [Enterobacter]MBA7853766.1 hypothetical protein [Enterobacter sp. RHBSTW-00901]QPK02423.1 hypothetical protein IDM36_10085 [Enterobacter mori]
MGIKVKGISQAKKHLNNVFNDALAGEFYDYVVLNCCDESGNCETGERRGSYEKWAWF